VNPEFNWRGRGGFRGGDRGRGRGSFGEDYGGEYRSEHQEDMGYDRGQGFSRTSEEDSDYYSAHSKETEQDYGGGTDDGWLQGGNREKAKHHGDQWVHGRSQGRKTEEPTGDLSIRHTTQSERYEPALEDKGVPEFSHDQYGTNRDKTESSQPSSKQTGPTISSLQKGGSTTVIPGLGSTDEPEEKEPSSVKEAAPPKEEEELKTSLKTQLLDVFSGAKAAKMVQSMERIVNQLHTLKGLESSLKVLQGDQNKEIIAVEEQAEIPEVDQEAAARRQVAALLATESDSDGEVSYCCVL
jgi:hypothetical protein